MPALLPESSLTESMHPVLADENINHIRVLDRDCFLNGGMNSQSNHGDIERTDTRMAQKNPVGALLEMKFKYLRRDKCWKLLSVLPLEKLFT